MADARWMDKASPIAGHGVATATGREGGGAGWRGVSRALRRLSLPDSSRCGRQGPAPEDRRGSPHRGGASLRRVPNAMQAPCRPSPSTARSLQAMHSTTRHASAQHGAPPSVDTMNSSLLLDVARRSSTEGRLALAAAGHDAEGALSCHNLVQRTTHEGTGTRSCAVAEGPGARARRRDRGLPRLAATRRARCCCCPRPRLSTRARPPARWRSASITGRSSGLTRTRRKWPPCWPPAARSRRRAGSTSAPCDARWPVRAASSTTASGSTVPRAW